MGWRSSAMAEFACSSANRKPVKNSQTDGSSIYYKVESVDDAYSDLKVKNVDLVFERHMVYEDETHELWMIFINCTEGNPVGLMEERSQIRPADQQGL